jgi:hypothetical protein
MILGFRIFLPAALLTLHTLEEVCRNLNFILYTQTSNE